MSSHRVSRQPRLTPLCSATMVSGFHTQSHLLAQYGSWSASHHNHSPDSGKEKGEDGEGASPATCLSSKKLPVPPPLSTPLTGQICQGGWKTSFLQVRPPLE